MQNSSRRWTEEEYSYLRQNYQTKTHEEMAQALGRTEKAVRNCCWRLSLQKKISKHPESVREAIKQAYEEAKGQPINLTALATRLGVDRAWACEVAAGYGLTDKARPMDERRAGPLAEGHARMLEENGHPRGMLGKTHSAEARLKISKAGKTRYQAMDDEERAAHVLKALKTKHRKGTLVLPRQNVTWKQGWHTVGGKEIYFRSHWEVNYAHYLEWLKQKGEIRSWEYEPTTFWFEAIKRGTRSYTPDFRVTEKNGSVAYHEVKGWMDARSKTKLKRMAKYHPDVTIVLVDAKAYRVLARTASRLVPGWTTS